MIKTKLTKANKRWLVKNYQKANLLYNCGLSNDEIGLVSRYIGSISNDNRYICPKCGDIYTVKIHKWIKMTGEKVECKYDKEIRERVEETIEDLIYTVEIEEEYDFEKLRISDFDFLDE